MVTYGSIVLCLVLCTGFFIRTKNYFNRNREMDNGPAIVTTIGVIFTFIGITYSKMTWKIIYAQQALLNREDLLFKLKHNRSFLLSGVFISFPVPGGGLLP